MKITQILSPLWLSVSSVYAATLNVGSGQQYSTVSLSPRTKCHSSTDLTDDYRSQQHTTRLRPVIRFTCTQEPTRRSSSSPSLQSRSRGPHIHLSTRPQIRLSSLMRPMLLMPEAMMLAVYSPPLLSPFHPQ